MAKEQKKNIFIDTYADWCIPCKKMDVEFLNNDLSSFLNENYINVRIDMDDYYHAAPYKKEFDIVFLPTMIVLDEHANVKYKTDKIIPSRELLTIVTSAMDPSVYFESDASKIISNPMNDKFTTTSSNRILHATGSGVMTSPDFLYREAYFRIELMDGSHIPIANKYLATQQDWLLPKNMRFILDFVHSTESELFKFLAKNVDAFRMELGTEQVQMTLNFLINDKLENGYPRPTFEEAKAFYKLLGNDNYETLAYEYYLHRLIEFCRYEEFLTMAREYEVKQGPKAHILVQMAESCYELNPYNHQCIEYLDQAISLQPNEKFYLCLAAEKYLAQNTRKGRKIADKYLEQARLLVVGQMDDHRWLQKLLQQKK